MTNKAKYIFEKIAIGPPRLQGERANAILLAHKSNAAYLSPTDFSNSSDSSKIKFLKATDASYKTILDKGILIMPNIPKEYKDQPWAQESRRSLRHELTHYLRRNKPSMINYAHPINMFKEEFIANNMALRREMPAIRRWATSFKNALGYLK